MATSYSCILFNLPDSVANSIKEWSIKNISDDKIWSPENKENHNKYVGGRKFDSHITVKYGLHTNSYEEIKKFFEENKDKIHMPFNVSFGNIEKFTPTGDYDVIIIKVDSPELRNLNSLICSNFSYTDPFPYDPHATIAYVKKNSCNDLVGTKANLQSLPVNELHFTTPDGGNHVIKTSVEIKKNIINKFSSYVPNPKSTMPSPIKKNYDYGEIPNWIDRVEYEEKKRKERKAKIDIIIKASLENIKFWISPEGKFYSWPVKHYLDDGIHHDHNIKELSGGKYNDAHEAIWHGWIRGGNINGNLYIDVKRIDEAIEAIQKIPKEFRGCDRVDLEASGQAPIQTNGQDPILALMRYKRDTQVNEEVYASMKLSKRDNVTANLIKTAYIVEENGKYCVKSEKGKNLGCSDTHEGAVKRLRQVEYFKHKG